ncbi:MAG: HlyD family type I secretion periplasmic adaptor subunit [Xanthobacteraceae bacterium]
MKSAESKGVVVQLRPSPAAARRVQLEFLPAALEIVETPASPAGRAIAATIILLFVIAIAWATFGRIDIVATASGKILPTGRTKLIQPFETGVVRAIRVQDGQTVKIGDVLVELDTTINAAERDRIAKELVAAQLTVARLHAAIAGMSNPEVSFEVPERASSAQIELQRRFLRNQIDEVRAKLAHIDDQITQNDASRAAVAATVQKLTLSIPLLRQRADVRHHLSDQGLGSKLQYWETQQDLVEHEQELVVQQARLAEAIAAITALREQRRQTEAEYNRTNLSDLADAEQKAASLGEALVGAEQRRQLQTLTAPVDGTVQQLAVHTIGGVVTPAQQLMVIVPADARLEAEAMVSNRDIGFVHAGEPVEVKIDTFNFTRYGLIHGKVASVSRDSIVRDKPADKSGATRPGALAETSEPQGQELLYAARIALDRTQMRIEDELINLSPGMAVTVEIKTGSRRVIEYLLSPLLRYKQESLRER